MRSSCTTFLALLITCLGATVAGADETRPNILFAIADDWGWPHAGALGDAVVETPTFDRIAAEGILFEHAYISSPSCTPSRSAILTGRYHWELGPSASLYGSLPQEVESYPHLLAAAGYHTGSWRKSWGPGRLTGKWAGDHPAGTPNKTGLGEFLESAPEGEPWCFWLGASDPHRGYKLGSGRDSGIDIDAVEPFPFFPDVEAIRSDIADYYFEVQRFDGDVGKAIALLEEHGVLDNTLVVMTGDHGMPFPRCKSNLYDHGARVPLAVRWGDKIQPGRISEDFVSTVDLAPTFLTAAGLEPAPAMTGRSLLPLFEGEDSGYLDPEGRDHILYGKERHVPSQEAPDSGGYPGRAIRTHRFLLIHNHEPDRWPNGTPDWQNAFIPKTWYGDTDNGPTKTYIVDNRERDEYHADCYAWCFEKRPEWELYDLHDDPDQLSNVADNPEYATQLEELQGRLDAGLRATNDPRATGAEQSWDTLPYGGGGPKFPGAK